MLEILKKTYLAGVGLAAKGWDEVEVLSKEIAKQKIEEALGTGAEAIISSCQQCVRTMMTYVRRNKIPLKVMDITQLLHSALES